MLLSLKKPPELSFPSPSPLDEIKLLIMFLKSILIFFFRAFITVDNYTLTCILIALMPVLPLDYKQCLFSTVSLTPTTEPGIQQTHNTAISLGRR